MHTGVGHFVFLQLGRRREALPTIFPTAWIRQLTRMNKQVLSQLGVLGKCFLTALLRTLVHYLANCLNGRYRYLEWLWGVMPAYMIVQFLLPSKGLIATIARALVGQVRIMRECVLLQVPFSYE